MAAPFGAATPYLEKTMKVKVVIGANYGDEGKGNVTNYLAGPDSAVVRFNGGAQAGHTVVHNDVRHVFHSLGSATMKDIPTIWGPEFVIDPVMILNEVDDLCNEMGDKYEPVFIWADPNCRIVTPYDVFLNQAIERKRGDKKHGSCGMGFGETVKRNKTDYGFKLKDYENVRDICARIESEYFWLKVEELDLDISPLCSDLDKVMNMFFESLETLVGGVNMAEFSELDECYYFVFEGAQGLCLDQNSPDFPHVTHSSTGLDNVLALLDPKKHEIEVYYVTRPYLTRHGAGPLRSEFERPIHIFDETNKPNNHQGSLRFAPLDCERMRDDIAADIDKAVKAGFKCVPHLMITCCDQISIVFPCGTEKSVLDRIIDNIGIEDYETCWGAAGDWWGKKGFKCAET